MKYIELTRGQKAKVDDEDFVLLSDRKWRAFGSDPERFCAAYTSYKKGKSVTYLMHRVIMNAPRHLYVDHINHDTLDNRKENLRLATPAQNSHNVRKNTSNKSGFKGVWWRKDRRVWVANLFLHGKQIILGHYKSKLDAAMSYNEGAKKHFGEFAYLNVIPHYPSETEE